MFIFALLKTTDHRESFFNYSYIKFVFNFQFEKNLIKLLLLIIIITIIIIIIIIIIVIVIVLFFKNCINKLFRCALLKTTDHREFFFNYSYIKFVFNFQFEKSLIKL